MKTRVKRISLDLDEQIKDLSIKNDMSYTDASRELASLSKNFKFRNNKIFREIRW